MGKTIHAHKLKRQRNSAYAARFPKRDKRARRMARYLRAVAREKRWFAAIGETPDGKRPLVNPPRGLR